MNLGKAPLDQRLKHLWNRIDAVRASIFQSFANPTNVITRSVWAAALGINNYVFITNASTSNGQGVGGPTAVAVVGLKAQYSGIFMWWASATQPAVAPEAATWNVTTQTGTGAIATTGGTAAVGASGPGAVGTATLLSSNGVAGTGIAITSGGGGELTQATEAVTIGTAGVGAPFGDGGILQNSVTAVATKTPFTIGNNVFLLLKITNSATNRVVSSINMALFELPV